MDDAVWAVGLAGLTTFVASASLDKYRGPPRRTAPTEPSPPGRPLPHRTRVQRCRHRRRARTRQAPTPRARPRRDSARDPCRTGTHAPPAVRAVGAALVIQFCSRSSSPSPPNPRRPSAHLDSSRTGPLWRVSSAVSRDAASADLRLAVIGVPAGPPPAVDGDHSWMTWSNNGAGRAQP